MSDTSVKPDIAAGDFTEDQVTDASGKDTSALPSFEDQVTTVVDGMDQDADGKWQVPEDTPEHIEYAARLERRRRNTQSALNRTQQDLVASEATAEAFKTKLENNVQIKLTSEQRQELEDLRESDPEKWRAKINEHEAVAKDSLNQELEEAGFDAKGIAEVERRAQVLEDHLKANPGLTLDDNVFENDLPPRITGKLEKGEITFEDFLVECTEFLTAGKTLKAGDEDEDEPNLGKTGGGGDVSKVQQEISTTETYDKEDVF